MNPAHKILYIGSGPSASLLPTLDLDSYDYIIGVNNSWRLFKDNLRLDYWIFSGDLPYENRPTNNPNILYSICDIEYSKASVNILSELNIVSKFPEQYIGYTIFFQGLYWIMDTFRPSDIHLLGFEHRYNIDKTKKWIDMGMPSPHNRFLKDSSISLSEWTNTHFAEFSPDSFYGHGTPDPLRLGEEYLRNKCILADHISTILNISIFNIVEPNTDINVFPLYDNLTRPITSNI